MVDAQRVVPEPELRTFLEALFRAAGCPEDHAARAADVLMIASLRGVDTHGVRMLRHYMEALEKGHITPTPDIRPVTQVGALEIWDGGGGLGTVIGSITMDRAIELARTHGIGWVGVRGGNHAAALGSFAYMAAERGFIGIANNTAVPTMTVPGSASKTVGNNPFAIAAPGPDFPVLHDIALSFTSWGRIGTSLRETGAPPEGALLNPDAPRDEWIALPLGGHKGSGLSIMWEILSGVITGAGLLSEMQSPEGRGKWGLTMAAIDISKLMPREEYDARIRQMTDEIKSAKSDPAGGEIRLPGERAERERKKRLREGVPLIPEQIATCEEFSEKLEVPLPW